MTIQTPQPFTPAVAFGKRTRLTKNQRRAQKRADFRKYLASKPPAKTRHTGLWIGLAAALSFTFIPAFLGLTLPKNNDLSSGNGPQLSNGQQDAFTPTPEPILHSDVRTEFPQWR